LATEFNSLGCVVGTEQIGRLGRHFHGPDGRGGGCFRGFGAKGGGAKESMRFADEIVESCGGLKSGAVPGVELVTES
jgi:hypothetical protein